MKGDGSSPISHPLWGDSLVSFEERWQLTRGERVVKGDLCWMNSQRARQLDFWRHAVLYGTMLGIIVLCIIIQVNSTSVLTESQYLAQHCTRTIMKKIKAECLQSYKYDCKSLQQLWWADNIIPKVIICYISIFCLVPLNASHQHVFVVLRQQLSFFPEIYCLWNIVTCGRELSDLETLGSNMHN